MTTGRKDDKGKLRYSLIPARALEAVADVLTYGAEKYGAWNWLHVKDADERYTDALFRHIEARRKGEIVDPESGKPHRAHIVATALFLLEFDLMKANAEQAEHLPPIALSVDATGERVIKALEKLAKEDPELLRDGSLDEIKARIVRDEAAEREAAAVAMLVREYDAARLEITRLGKELRKANDAAAEAERWRNETRAEAEILRKELAKTRDELRVWRERAAKPAPISVPDTEPEITDKGQSQ